MSAMVACVLLAAGNGVRFGGNKLLAYVNGQTMIEIAATLHGALPYALRVAVTRTGDTELQRRIDTDRFRIAENPAPEAGISQSVRIGLSDVLQEAEVCGITLDGVLFSVSDQPQMSKQTVERMLVLFSEQPNRIVVPVTADGRRGNPVIFPAALFPELLSITGDRGGGTVIGAHPELLLPCAVDAEELIDIDTLQDAALANRKRS